MRRLLVSTGLVWFTVACGDGSATRVGSVVSEATPEDAGTEVAPSLDAGGNVASGQAPGDGGPMVTTAMDAGYGVEFMSPRFPPDVSGGVQGATFEDAAQYAWSAFIALQWPAAANARGRADATKAFGDPNARPVTWETMRSNVEVYPGSGAEPPGFVNDGSESFGYAALPPHYVYGTGELPPCAGQAAVATPAWVNLDGANELIANELYAGAAPAHDLSAGNSAPQLVRYAMNENATDYAYVVDPAHPYWTQGAAFTQASNNFLAVSTAGGAPSQLSGPIVTFPVGSIEVKSAWRPLSPSELASGRFYESPVRYYESAGTDGGASYCYREAVWGLVGFHIMHKTPTAPTWTFSTFEQSDTILTAGGSPLEGDDGDVISVPSAATPYTPAVSYADGVPEADGGFTAPQVSIAGTAYCTDPGDRLAFQELAIGFGGAPQPGLPTGGRICINSRINPIPDPVVAVNRSVHAAMRAYASAHGLGDSPWLHYKLVNVQWRPFDVTEVSSDPTSVNSSAIYHTANVTLESDYTLQQFSGTFGVDGAPTMLPPNFPTFGPKRQTHVNELTFDARGTLTGAYTMGGCMGCHGDISVGFGTDSSYALADGPEFAPEVP